MQPQFATVALGSLRLEHEFFTNPRTITGLDDSDIADLADDIAKRGIRVPIDVVQAKGKEPGKIELVVFDGQRRVRAGREALKPGAAVPVKYLNDKPIELDWEKADAFLIDVLLDGGLRAPLSSYELSEVAERLQMRNPGWTLETIAHRIRKSEGWVSRMLKARKSAHPSTLKAWKSGKLTDEQFKDVASIKHDEQPAALGEADEIKAAVDAGEISARDAKTETRARLKEKVEVAKVEAKKAKAPPAAVQTVKNGHNVTLAKTSPAAPAPPPAPERKPPSRAELEAVLDMAKAKAPTADYVKGILHGVEYALGLCTPEQFGRSWGKYLQRVTGVAVAKKKPTKARKAPKKPASDKARSARKGKK